MDLRPTGKHRRGGPGVTVLAGLSICLLAGACRPSATPEPTPRVDATWERIQSTGIIVVGTAGDYAPFESYGDQDQLEGFDVALMQAIGQHLGLRVELNDFAFNGLGDALRLGQVDAAIAAISVTAAREAVLDFSDAYYVGTGVALVRQGAAIDEVSSVAQLSTHRVGAEKGSVYLADLQRLVATGAMPAENVRSYASLAEGVKDLKRDRLDAFLLDEQAAKRVLEEGGLEIAGEGATPQRYAIAIPQGAATLQAELNRALQELAKDGTLAELRERYLGARPEVSIPAITPGLGPTSTPPSSACIDGMAHIEDLSFDDDDMRAPPEVEKELKFDKIWRLRNVGTCTWTNDYALRYVHGNRPSARMDAGTATISDEVRPGGTIEVIVAMVAPSESGTYRGFWQMFNASGEPFGETVWVGISVPTETPAPTHTTTPVPTVPSGPAPTWTPTPPPFVGQSWVLVSMQDPSGDLSSDLAPGAALTAEFTEDGSFYGTSGCNSYEGNYRAKEGYITITAFNFTRDACPTDELNDQENRFLPFMEKATRFEVDGNRLKLLRGDNVTLVFRSQ